MDYTKCISVTNFGEYESGEAKAVFTATVCLTDLGENNWYFSDTLKNAFFPSVFDSGGYVTGEWRCKNAIPQMEVRDATPEGLTAKITEIVEGLKKSLDAVDRRNIEVAAEKSRAATIVTALAAIDFIGASSSQISAIASAVSADERKNTMLLVRGALAKITYAKSALKAIADL